MPIKVLISDSPEKTEELAQTVGRKLRGSEVIDLVSDLGGGKTTFVRGLAHGAGSSDRVASPTFTLSKIYEAKGLELHHFDFYRLNEPGLLGHELHDLFLDPQVVVIVEWSDVVRHILPNNRLSICLEKEENARKLTLEYPDSLAYLVEDL